MLATTNSGTKEILEVLETLQIRSVSPSEALRVNTAAVSIASRENRLSELAQMRSAADASGRPEDYEALALEYDKIDAVYNADHMRRKAIAMRGAA